MKRFGVGMIIICLGLLVGLPATQSFAQSLCFPADKTPYCYNDPFSNYWEQNGGLPVFGYPITAAAQEYNLDLQGNFLTQWAERNRLEDHPENAGSAYRILLGRLGVERLAQLGRNPQQEDPESGPRVGCLWFEITRHNVCNQEGDIGFKAYWETHGLSVPGLDAYGRSLQLFGLPLTAPRIETNSSGHTVLTQWFERARFEWHPNNPSEFKVLLGLLGKEVRMNGGTPTTNPTATTKPANSTPNPNTSVPTSPPAATATIAPYPQPISPPVATATVAPYPQPTSPPAATATSQPTATPPPPASPTPNQMDFVNRVISRTNMYRQQHSCPALTFNQLLTNAAQGHAVDMATHDFVGHTGSDGSSPWDRMERAGYLWSAAAENAAAGYSSPESVVDGWYNEVPPNDGHRLNILNCGLQDIGVGYYYLANDTGTVNYHHYWVQLFRTPR